MSLEAYMMIQNYRTARSQNPPVLMQQQSTKSIKQAPIRQQRTSAIGQPRDKQKTPLWRSTVVMMNVLLVIITSCGLYCLIESKWPDSSGNRQKNLSVSESINKTGLYFSFQMVHGFPEAVKYLLFQMLL